MKARANDKIIQAATYKAEKLLLVMQACLIDAEAGRKDIALSWIWNTLDGPGLIPDFDEARAMGGAQAYFDREISKLPEIP